MAWRKSPDRILFHGTLYHHAIQIVGGTNKFDGSTVTAPQISLAACSAFTDFGQGFYTTTNEHQARQWANDRCQPWNGPDSQKVAAVVAFDIDWDDMGSLQTLGFVWEGAPPGSDYWTLVAHCRAGKPNRTGTGATGPFDVVLGPVSLWTQYIVLAQCDQISFHTNVALGYLRNGRMHAEGSLMNPFL